MAIKINFIHNFENYLQILRRKDTNENFTMNSLQGDLYFKKSKNYFSKKGFLKSVLTKSAS